ncbi:MAG: hypothetical protein A2284_05810 [Deltaproteobacteria bacterium RIFOXYA12_FULL_61_11]|nr:MAG: hypothetical protein A2284_05810 [Deltaproteobacteria bacterium RIFOXYA12_FULL_61_11]
MSWFATMFGGALGWSLGGPLGGLAGAALGSLLDKALEQSTTTTKTELCPRCGRPIPTVLGVDCPACSAERPEPSELARHQYAFFVATFSLLAKLAKADGVVTRPELDRIEDFMRRRLQLSREQRALAIAIFEQAKNRAFPVETLARQYLQLSAGRRELLYLMLQILFEVASADGHFHPAEQTLIDEVASIFGVTEQEYRALRASFVPQTGGDYALLGLTPEAGERELKAAYRRLAKEHHPDVAMAKGLPPEFVELAKRRFQDLGAAYERIKQARGLT